MKWVIESGSCKVVTAAVYSAVWFSLSTIKWSSWKSRENYGWMNAILSSTKLQTCIFYLLLLLLSLLVLLNYIERILLLYAVRTKQQMYTYIYELVLLQDCLSSRVKSKFSSILWLSKSPTRLLVRALLSARYNYKKKKKGTRWSSFQVPFNLYIFEYVKGKTRIACEKFSW